MNQQRDDVAESREIAFLDVQTGMIYKMCKVIILVCLMLVNLQHCIWFGHQTKNIERTWKESRGEQED